MHADPHPASPHHRPGFVDAPMRIAASRRRRRALAWPASSPDRDQQVTFTSRIRACDAGRHPRLHLGVSARVATVIGGRDAELATEPALPAAVADADDPVAAGDGQTVTNLARVSLATDDASGDDGAIRFAPTTPTMTGNATAGFVATANAGIVR